MKMMMDSRRIKKMLCRVAKVSSGKPNYKAAPILQEKHSLINTADHPISDSNSPIHHHVPKGFMAVYVGPGNRRFIIPTKILSVPDFKALMDRAAEEYGYQQQGGLTIPCDEDDFQKLLAAANKCNSS